MNASAIGRERVPRAVVQRPGRVAILLLAMLAVLPMISPARAHQVQPATTPTPAVAEIADPIGPPKPAPAPGVPAPQSPDRELSAIVLTSLLILLTVIARRRRPVALALVLIALVFAFESGVHSVHHLGSPSEAAHCAVAVATTHSPGVAGEAGVDLDAPFCGRIGAANLADEAPTSGVHRAFRARAPPACSLACV